jgi:hypothetical protein
MGFVAFLVFPVFGKHVFACFGYGFSLKCCRSYMCTWFYLRQLWLLIEYCCLPASNFANYPTAVATAFVGHNNM